MCFINRTFTALRARWQDPDVEKKIKSDKKGEAPGLEKTSAD